MSEDRTRSIGIRKTLSSYRCRCSITVPRARAYTRVYAHVCHVSSPWRRSPSCEPECEKGRGTNTNGYTSGAACKMLFPTTFRRFCALCIVVQIYTGSEEMCHRHLFQRISVFQRRERGPSERPLAVSADLSSFPVLYDRQHAFRVDFHLAAVYKPEM